MEKVLLTLVTLSWVLAGIFFLRRKKNYTGNTFVRYRKPNDPSVEWDEKKLQRLVR